jgi:tRNA modification GTPase
LEIHCHGGDAAARRIIAELEQADCPQHAWQTAGPFFETECTVALTRAVTLRTAALLLEQQSGVLHDCFARLAGTVWSPEGRGVAQSELEALLSWADFGLHLTQPWNVVLAGRPNVGKSSLINALVGYARSVVFDLPGTTRDVVTAEAAFAGWPVQLADTAGIRDNAPELEAAGIERTQARLAAADCRVLVLDVSEPPHADDRRLLAAWPDAICLAHKADLPNVWGGELPAQARAASARTGQGIAELAEEIVAALVPRVPAAGTPLPVTRRQVELLERAHESLVRTDEPAFRAALRCLTASAN